MSGDTFVALPVVRVFVDDEEAYVPRVITNRKNENIVFTPMVAVGAGPYDITAAWQGAESPVRMLHVPTFGIPVGTHNLYLKTPDNDVPLGAVEVVERT
jgi:hypothetical protein